MAKYSEAQNKATQKYIKGHLEEIRFRVRKGEKAKYQEAAAAMGLSVAKFFLLAADELIDRSNEELPFDTAPEFDKK